MKDGIGLKSDRAGQEDPGINDALRHFRESVHAWSQAELDGRSRFRQDDRHSQTRNFDYYFVQRPVMAFALAGCLAVSAVVAPIAEHYHQLQLVAQRERVMQEQHLHDQQQIANAAREQQAVYAMNDDDLLSHVDSDIAQGTPDAMEPLESLMSDNQDVQVRKVFRTDKKDR